MTDPTEAILTYLHHVGAGLDPDFFREAVRMMSALLMEVEVKQLARQDADRFHLACNASAVLERVLLTSWRLD